MTDNLSESDLLAQMAAMQEQINALRSTSPGSVDPVESHVQALKAHTTMLSKVHPAHDLSELLDVVNDLPWEDGLTTRHTELLKETIAEVREKLAPIAHDFAYVWDLARALHRLILKG